MKEENITIPRGFYNDLLLTQGRIYALVDYVGVRGSISMASMMAILGKVHAARDIETKETKELKEFLDKSN